MTYYSKFEIDDTGNLKLATRHEVEVGTVERDDIPDLIAAILGGPPPSDPDKRNGIELQLDLLQAAVMELTGIATIDTVIDAKKAARLETAALVAIVRIRGFLR